MAGTAEKGIDYLEITVRPGNPQPIDEIEKLDKVARGAFGLDIINPAAFRSTFSPATSEMGPVFDTESADKPDVKGFPKGQHLLASRNRLQSADAEGRSL